MRRIRVVVLLVAAVSVIPAMAFGHGAPAGAWCGGSYGEEGTNFSVCPSGPSNPQVAGPASGISGQGGSTEPQYPASQVTFGEDGRPRFNQQPLNLQFVPSPDRSREIQTGGGD